MSETNAVFHARFTAAANAICVAYRREVGREMLLSLAEKLSYDALKAADELAQQQPAPSGVAAEGVEAVAFHIQHPDGFVSLRKAAAVDSRMVEQAAVDGVVIRPLIYGDTTPPTQGAGVDEAMEEWHSVMNDAGELFTNALDSRYSNRASRVVTWIKQHPPTQGAGVDEAMVERLREIAESLADQQAMPDDSWKREWEAALVGQQQGGRNDG